MRKQQDKEKIDPQGKKEKERHKQAKIGMPDFGFVRLDQIIGNPTTKPPIPPILPIGKSTWWAGIKSGRFPQPVRLGPRSVAWSAKAIRALVDELSAPVA